MFATILLDNVNAAFVGDAYMRLLQQSTRDCLGLSTEDSTSLETYFVEGKSVLIEAATELKDNNLLSAEKVKKIDNLSQNSNTIYTKITSAQQKALTLIKQNLATINQDRKNFDKRVHTLTGYFAKKYLDSTTYSILKRIIGIFVYIFPRLKQEVAFQFSYIQNLHKINEEIESLNDKKEQINSVVSVITLKMERIHKLFQVTLNYNASIEKVYELFGGKEAFEQVPKLEINNIWQLMSIQTGENANTAQKATATMYPKLSTDDSSDNSIDARMITHPIMRGVTKEGVLFFIIRGHFIGDKELRYQTYWKSIVDSDWRTISCPLPIFLEANFISYEKALNEKNYKELTLLIQKKACEITNWDEKRMFYVR